jgi:hypothetical protein
VVMNAGWQYAVGSTQLAVRSWQYAVTLDRQLPTADARLVV